MASRLDYGHFGQAAYDQKEHVWKFQREYGGLKQSFQAQEAQEVLPSSATTISHNDADNSVLDLVKRNPELEPAWGIIDDFLRDDTAKNPESEGLGPAGKLLAFGYGSYTSNAVGRPSSQQSVPIIAAPGGANKEVLRISTLAEPRSCVTWSANAEPIRQVCFAHSTDGNGAFLAVRLSTRTVIFWTTCSPEDSDSEEDDNSAQINWSLELNAVANIPISTTGGFPHADVCFDPADQWRFAVIDVKGHIVSFGVASQFSKNSLPYEVWKTSEQDLSEAQADFSSRFGRNLTTNQEEIVDEDEDEQQEEDMSILDFSWCRMLWLEEKLLVVTREHLLSVSATKGMSVIDLDLTSFNRGPVEVLDIQKHPLSTDEIFVLTSRRILGLKLVNSSWAGDNAAVKAKLVLSWTHHRDREDDSLSLSITPHSTGKC